jgi:nitric oxide reductase activation protein
MSWTEQNAFKRIYNVFKRNKNNIYSEDIEALKLLNTALENKNKEFVTQNLLYAKLLAIHLNQNLMYYGSIEEAIKKIKYDLSLSLNYNLIYLQKNLNNTELTNYFNSIGVNISNPHLLNETQIENDKNIISDKQKEIIEQLKKNWDFELVEKSFIKTANELLKDVNYYE